MKNKVLLITLGLLVLLLPLVANAGIVESGDCGNGVVWSVDNNGLLKISGSGYMTSSPWDGYNVQVSRVVIENGVRNIYDGAFSGMDIVSVTIPQSVTIIGDEAFSYCTDLSSIVIPDSVKTIGDYVFQGCTSLRTVTLSNSLTGIPVSAFRNCESLNSIVIPDSVKTIEWESFYKCENLSSITLPKGLTSIGGGVFLYCTSLNNVTIPNSVSVLSQNLFSGCTSLTNVTLPTSLSVIEWRVFQKCSKLSSLVVPGKNVTIYESAFVDCTGLKKIVFQGEINEIQEKAFKNCFELSSIELPICNTYAIQWFKDNGFEDALKYTPHALKKHDKEEPTAAASGTEAYWKCTVCGKMFSDAEGNNEINKPVVIPATGGDSSSEQFTFSKLKSVKLKAISAKKIEVKWKKLSKKDQKKIQKIQIQYSTDKTFKTGVKTKWAKKGKDSYTIKSLKKNTKYWVRIRAYKKSGNVIYVSKWVVKSKKTKKK